MVLMSICTRSSQEQSLRSPVRAAAGSCSMAIESLRVRQKVLRLPAQTREGLGDDVLPDEIEHDPVVILAEGDRMRGQDLGDALGGVAVPEECRMLVWHDELAQRGQDAIRIDRKS